MQGKSLGSPLKMPFFVG